MLFAVFLDSDSFRTSKTTQIGCEERRGWREILAKRDVAECSSQAYQLSNIAGATSAKVTVKKKTEL
jgi:hypothetical protein